MISAWHCAHWFTDTLVTDASSILLFEITRAAWQCCDRRHNRQAAGSVAIDGAIPANHRGFEAYTWQGIGAPGRTPIDIAATLNKEVNAGLANPKIRARLADLGSAPMPMSPADFESFIVAETEKWGKVIRAAHINVE